MPWPHHWRRTKTAFRAWRDDSIPKGTIAANRLDFQPFEKKEKKRVLLDTRTVIVYLTCYDVLSPILCITVMAKGDAYRAAGSMRRLNFWRVYDSTRNTFCCACC